VGDKVLSLVGILGFVGIAYAFSRDRSKIDWKLVCAGIALQFAFAMIILWSSPGRAFFQAVNQVVDKLLGFTFEGSKFIFGERVLNATDFGFVFAVQVLPTIVFFSALMGVLYHLGVMQFIVNMLSKAMVKVLGTSGAETLSATANIFVGQTEAPLLIKPYVSKMTQSELMVVMTGGFATVAGGVLAAYVALLKPFFPDIAGHLMAASIMSAPAALVMAKILVPEVEEPATKGAVSIDVESEDANLIEAAANGASVGLTLALNVGAMLLAFIALIAMADGILGWFGSLFQMPNLSLSLIMSYLFAPLALLMGVPTDDCLIVGDLLGKKLIVNEFVAYSELAQLLNEGETPLSGRSVVILTYALCGFANLSSIGIQIGGIGGIAPERKSDLARLGLVAVLGGTLACFQTANIAGVFISASESQLITSQKAAPSLPSPSPSPMSSPDPADTPGVESAVEEATEVIEQSEAAEQKKDTSLEAAPPPVPDDI